MRFSPFTTTPSNRNAYNRSLAAWLGMCAVLLHTGLLFSQGISVSWLNTGTKAPSYILLCSAFGAKTVLIKHQDNSSNSQDSKQCPVCQLYGLGKTWLPMASLLLSTASPYVASLLPGLFDCYLSRQPFVVASPRGPPCSLIVSTHVYASPDRSIT
jgi:hypothetical protein